MRWLRKYLRGREKTARSSSSLLFGRLSFGAERGTQSTLSGGRPICAVPLGLQARMRRPRHCVCHQEQADENMWPEMRRHCQWAHTHPAGEGAQSAPMPYLRTVLLAKQSECETATEGLNPEALLIRMRQCDASNVDREEIKQNDRGTGRL
jgi:hypothetical protein